MNLSLHISAINNDTGQKQESVLKSSDFYSLIKSELAALTHNDFKKKTFLKSIYDKNCHQLNQVSCVIFYRLIKNSYGV